MDVMYRVILWNVLCDVYLLCVCQVVDGDAGQLVKWYKSRCILVHNTGSELAAAGC